MPRLLRLIVACVVASALALAAASSAMAAGWLPPVEAFKADSSAAVGFPRVSVDDAGNVYATWMEGSALEVSKRPVGGVWETPQTIDPGPGATASVPDIGVDGAGNAVLVWKTTAGSGTPAIFQSRRAASASSFDAGARLKNGTPSVGRPRVAVNRAGRAVIAFANTAMTTPQVTVGIGTASAGFAAAALQVYSEGGSAAADDPEAALNEAGDAAVAWTHNEGSSYIVHAAYAPRDTNFQGTLGVAGSSSNPESNPRVALDVQGQALVVWVEGPATSGVIKASARSPGAAGTWSEFKNDLDGPFQGTGIDPQAAFDLVGAGLAAWGGDNTLRGSILPAGGTDFTHPPQSFTDNTEAPFDLQLDSNPAGFSVLVWAGSANGVARAMVRPNGGTFGPVATLSPAGHGADSTRVAVDPQGNAAAVWVDYFPVDKNSKIVTAEYDATPPKFTGTPAAPDTAERGKSASFSAVATDDWSQPTIAWDFGDGGSATGGLVTHTYSKAGTFTVTTTATDGAGNSLALTHDVKVTAPPVIIEKPTRGKDFNASEVSGTVLVSLPKGKGSGRILARAPVHAAAAAAISPPSGYTQFRPLGKNDNIPVGSILDSTRGISQITMAANKAGTKLQKGKFSKGVFRIKQTTHSPLTSAEMMGGGNFKRDCRRPRGKVSTARRRPHRQLFANVHGRFRTRGRHSTATVRGTKYLVKESCKGTMTIVTQGRVVVRDFRKHRTVTVRTGHRYLARQ